MGVSNDQAPATDGPVACKKDAGKAPLFRGVFEYFARALPLVAAVSAMGAEKYAWGAWVGVPNAHARYMDAMLRHAAAMSRGEELDAESGFPHAAHMAWNALAIVELKERSRAA